MSSFFNAIVSARVRIVNENGIVEDGAVVRGVGYRWTYTATQNDDDTATIGITVTASDLPGNVTEHESSP